MLFSSRTPILLLALAVLCAGVKPDRLSRRVVAGRMDALPMQTLWVWERSEDLRDIDPGTTAIAVLERTIILGSRATVIPRRQSLVYPQGTKRIAVVRLEAPGIIASGLEQQTAELILESAQGWQPAALQVDFDARRSQRGFYTKVLEELRRRMPSQMPLSITALASWCSYDDWLGGLPVDEAVPMFFRMEPDRRYAPPDLPQFRIREPLCMQSAGISTREASAASLTGKRVYIFSDRGWREDLALLPGLDPAHRSIP